MRRFFLGLLICTFAAPAADFVAVPGPMPSYDSMMPKPPVAPPPGTRTVAYDVHGNYWALAPAQSKLPLLVLPADKPNEWIPETESGIKGGQWKYLAADENGLIWLASARQVLCLEPLYGKSWHSISDDSAFPRDEITAMAIAPSGAVLVAFASGRLAELDRVQRREGRTVWIENVIQIQQAPAKITQLMTDADGRIWAAADGKIYRLDAAEKAWQKDWVLAARMPGSNHDLSGDITGGRFYAGGGVTAGWGYPPKHTIFQDLLEFDPVAAQWRVAAKLGIPRGYNATSVLDGDVWVIGGDVELVDGKRLAVGTVQICNPRTGEVRMGPQLPIAMPMPLAVHINGRIYTAGSPKDEYKEPGKLFSIGTGEKAWRQEPDGPIGMGPLAGTAHDSKFYVVVPNRSLAIFDTVKRTWTEVIPPKPSRSGQVAAYKGEIWLMGGAGVRDNVETHIYNPKNGVWRTGPDLPRPTNWGAAATVNGRLMVTGGAGGRCYNNRTFLLREKP